MSVGIPSHRSFSLDGTNNGEWWAQKTAADTWKVWSKGTIGKVTRNLYVEVTPNAVITNTPTSYAWHYGLFVASSVGCTNFVGNSDITMSIWAAGDLCLSGGQIIKEPSSVGAQEVDLYVAEKLTSAAAPPSARRRARSTRRRSSAAARRTSR